MFLGVNLTFFPQHFLGLRGMPRRYPEYHDCFSFFNLISRWGSTVSVFSLFFFLTILWEALLEKRSLMVPLVPIREPE